MFRRNCRRISFLCLVLIGAAAAGADDKTYAVKLVPVLKPGQKFHVAGTQQADLTDTRSIGEKVVGQRGFKFAVTFDYVVEVKAVDQAGSATEFSAAITRFEIKHADGKTESCPKGTVIASKWSEAIQGMTIDPDGLLPESPAMNFSKGLLWPMNVDKAAKSLQPAAAQKVGATWPIDKDAAAKALWSPVTPFKPAGVTGSGTLVAVRKDSGPPTLEVKTETTGTVLTHDGQDMKGMSGAKSIKSDFKASTTRLIPDDGSVPFTKLNSDTSYVGDVVREGADKVDQKMSGKVTTKTTMEMAPVKE